MMRSPTFMIVVFGASALAACSSGSSSSATASPAASPAPTATPAVATKQVSFTDIKGGFGQQAIRDEAALGILDSTTGGLKPNAPVTRAQFVRWLVKVAKTGPPQFVDVPVGNKDFQYIQGLANAGYVIGIDKTHFAPNRPLTREELVAIKAPVDEGGDVAKINPHYTPAIGEDASVPTTQNISRVWGTLRAFSPQNP